MKYIFLFLIIILILPNLYAQKDQEQVISEVFNTAGITGTFIVYDLNKDTYICNDSVRANTGFLPASTFKIFNSLTALETGAIKDEEEIIRWDSIPRNWDMWNQDHNLRTAIKYSVVWFYQELARRIGAEKMQHYLDKAEYGNRNIQEGIDLFWLQGDFRVTPMEQITFLKKLYYNELPFSVRSHNIVKEIMIKKQTDDYVIHAKTGWAGRTNPQTGWYVGYVEKKDNTYFFVMNMDIKKDEDAAKREELTYLILRKLNITKD
jgi:beta-lactamase class D